MHKDNFYYILKERLEYANEYLLDTSAFIKFVKFSSKVEKEFYKDKPLKNFALKLYFLPLNLFGYLLYLKTWHYFEMTCREIEMLKKEISDESNK